MNRLKGKFFMFTGATEVPRHEAQRQLEELGGYADSSLSSSTDYLVVGERPGSKLEKAKDLSVQIIEDSVFWSWIKEAREEESDVIELKDGRWPTDEEWAKIASWGIPTISEDSLYALIEACQPSYKNPKKLQKLLSENPEIELLPPSVCKFCGKLIPYSVHSKTNPWAEDWPGPGSYFCFECSNYSTYEKHNHYWVLTGLGSQAITEVGTTIYACSICSELIPLDQRDEKEILTWQIDNRHFNSVEYLVYKKKAAKEQAETLELLKAAGLGQAKHVCTDWLKLEALSDESGTFWKCQFCGYVKFVRAAVFADSAVVDSSTSQVESSNKDTQGSSIYPQGSEVGLSDLDSAVVDRYVKSIKSSIDRHNRHIERRQNRVFKPKPAITVHPVDSSTET